MHFSTNGHRRARRLGPYEERIVVLGAGFGGLELATILSEAFGDDAASR